MTMPEGWGEDNKSNKDKDKEKDDYKWVPITSAPPSSAPPNINNNISSSSRGGEDATGLIIGLITFLGGVALMVVVVFTLNFYLLVFGGIMFIIGVIIFTWPGGVGSSRGSRYRGGGGYGGHGPGSGAYMYSWGSHQAKKNMIRGHRYSKK